MTDIVPGKGKWRNKARWPILLLFSKRASPLLKPEKRGFFTPGERLERVDGVKKSN